MTKILKNVDYGRDLASKVSKNFTYYECVASETAVLNGIANIPSEEEWNRIERVVKDVLQPLRDKLGVPLIVNSFFRCEELNKLAGGSETSFHRLGFAVDVDCRKLPLMTVLEEAVKGNWTEIIAEYFPEGWVHIAYNPHDARKMLKLKDANHDFSRVSLDYIKGIYG